MLKLAAVLLLLGACAPAYERPQVWLEPSDLLFAAQQAWGLPLPFMPELNETLTAAELPAECGEPWKKTLDGCAQAVSGEIWVASDLSPERRAVGRAHELGHVLSFWFAGAERSQEHITEGCAESPALMCPKGSESPEPTPADFDFVLGR
jgi:hypothetical protein